MKKIVLIITLFNSLLFSEETFIDSSRIKNPQLAWKLSIIPGLGQLYNHSYIKAGLIWSMEGYAIFQWKKFNYTNQIGKRNTYAWWIIGLYVWGMLDAYVDAQMSTFPSENNDTNKEG